MEIPLAFLSEDDEGKIIRMEGGRGLVRRLYDMGFVPSTKIKILSNGSSGPILVGIRGSRIAIGRGIAMKIMIDQHDHNRSINR